MSKEAPQSSCGECGKRFDYAQHPASPAEVAKALAKLDRQLLKQGQARPKDMGVQAATKCPKCGWVALRLGPQLN